MILAAHAIQRERGGSVQRPGRNWSKFGRSRSFFFSSPAPLLLLNCQILLSLDAEAWHRHGDGPGLSFSAQTALLD